MTPPDLSLGRSTGLASSCCALKEARHTRAIPGGKAALPRQAACCHSQEGAQWDTGCLGTHRGPGPSPRGVLQPRGCSVECFSLGTIWETLNERE